MSDLQSSIWNALKAEAEQTSTSEPILSGILSEYILDRNDLIDALSWRVSSRLAKGTVSESELRDLFKDCFSSDTTILNATAHDLEAVKVRDPACDDYLSPFLYFKGFQALCAYRACHSLWIMGRKQMALYVQSLVSIIYSVDIHPAARIGKGILLDHATGFVAGETSEIEDDVSILHEVTLGGTGKERGDRHPKIRSGVLIGAGAKILGNVEIGEGARVGASSVVLNDVPARVSVAGVPAKVVGSVDEGDLPYLGMNHTISSAPSYDGGGGI